MARKPKAKTTHSSVYYRELHTMHFRVSSIFAICSQENGNNNCLECFVYSNSFALSTRKLFPFRAQFTSLARELFTA